MTDDTDQWERKALEKIAMAAVAEQRRARRWGIFFKLLFFAYLTWIILLVTGWHSGEAPRAENHTALVDIDGLIVPGGDASADRITAALEAAFEDEHTKGVVLRINSPGGSPVQAQMIYDEMRRLRKKYPNIPLYAVVEDLCASGGYYVAVGADRIYVSKSSIVGSIGVRMDGFGVTGLMDKLGIERRLLTAGKNKALLDPFLPVDKEQEQYVLGLLKDVHEQFIHTVREGRGNRLKETPNMFSGLIWTGQKGIELGLVDAIGTLDYVAREVVKADEIVDYTQKENLAERIAKRFGASVASALAEIALRERLVLR
jgi:protease IV